MPELPEVENVCRGLAPVLTGRTIVSARTGPKRLRFPYPRGFASAMAGAAVTAVTRRAKYIVIHLKDGRSLLCHLGMSGSFRCDPPGSSAPRQPHDHAVFTLSDGATLIYNDPRRFGFIDLTSTQRLDAHPRLKNLGPEPLSRAFTPVHLLAALSGKKIPVKVALMDAAIVVGVGNIYASEALYAAGISPLTPAGCITPAQAAALAPAIKTVLKRAIAAGGSTLRNYRRVDNTVGSFQSEFAVYGREGQPCPGCGRKCPGIRRIAQAGRSTFYCPAKQR